MRLSLHLRQWLTACVLGFMLLAQQAAAAYVCTTSLQDMAQAAAGMPDCEENGGTSVTALCLQHCASGGETTSTQADFPWTVSAAPAPVFFLANPAIVPPAINVRHHLAHAPAPPLIVRLQRLLL
jgi:hypothetical protein